MSAAPGRDRAVTHDGVATGPDDGSEGPAEYQRSTASARVEQLLASRARSAVPSVRDVLGPDAIKDRADLDLVPLGAKSALTGAPVTRVPRSKSARPVPRGRTAGAGGLWERGKSTSALYSDSGASSGSDADLSAGDAAHLDASLWGGHPELLGADAAARPLRTTKSFITPLSSRAHVMENARKRAAEEREKRRAAAATAAAGDGAVLGDGGGAAGPRWTGDGEQGEEAGAPSTASRRAQDKARAQLLFQRQAEDWARAHGAAPPRRRLAPAVTKMVEQWFSLVDDDSSGALEAHELAAALSLQILSPIALQAAGVPCDESDIRELVRIIDVNHDGSVTWAEFQSFLLKELQC
eukprot:XP_001700162.1 predicted protein [Chlamydomonas reinhardtii]